MSLLQLATPILGVPRGLGSPREVCWIAFEVLKQPARVTESESRIDRMQFWYLSWENLDKRASFLLGLLLQFGGCLVCQVELFSTTLSWKLGASGAPCSSSACPCPRLYSTALHRGTWQREPGPEWICTCFSRWHLLLSCSRQLCSNLQINDLPPTPSW